jgi:hypothetical protein
MEWTSKVSILLVVTLLIGLAYIREYIEGFQAKPEINQVNLDLTIYDLEISQVMGDRANYPLFLFGDSLEFNCINYAVEHLTDEISKIKIEQQYVVNYYGETVIIFIAFVGNNEYSYKINDTEYKGNAEAVSKQLLTYKTESI